METEIILSHRAGGIEEVQGSLGNTGNFRRVMGDLLDESARVGEQSAQIYAPERTRRLKREIRSIPARQAADGGLEARVGVGEVNSLPGGRSGPLREGQSMYPLRVHEGTGIFGDLHRLITPRHAKAMVFMGRAGIVHAKTTRGQPAQPYMADAFVDVQAYIRGRTELAVRELLRT